MGQQLELTFEARARLLTADQIFDLETADWLKVVSEGPVVERKPVGIHARELAEYFSMWANTAPDGGIIAVGVTNDGLVDGILGASPARVNDLERAGDVYCCDARCRAKRVEVVNRHGASDQILLIRVYYRDDKLVLTHDGKAYLRRGESKVKLKPDETKELQISKGEVSFEQEPSALSYPEDFNLAAIRDFSQCVIEKQGLQHTENSEEILATRRLGRFIGGNFRPNKACALLFAKDPLREVPGCKIRFLRFDGKEEGTGDRFNAIKDQWIEGTIPDVIVKIETVLESQLREFSRLGPDGKFRTAPEYPKPAWYEAIVNACCHRSYNFKNVPIFVKMFDDRLEIESPGGFMPFVTPENIYDQHHPRNPDMMAALSFLAFVKCAHEGTRRMRQTMSDLQLPPPKFSESNTSHVFFRVTLKNDVEHRKAWLDSDASRFVGETIFRTLTDYEKRVINHVAEYKRVNTSDTMRLTGRNWHTSRNLLRKLAQRGILKEVRRNQSRDTTAHYILPN